MKLWKWTAGCTAAVSVLALAAATAPALATPTPSATPTPTPTATAVPVPPGPSVKLIAASNIVTVPVGAKTRRFFVDPGVYVAAVGGKLQFDVQRANYASPRRITQTIGLPHGIEVRSLPASLVPSWRGLARFLRVTVKNSSGKIVADRVLPFCPDSYTAQRSDPDSPLNNPFPQSCSGNPFQLGNIWGLQRGWAVDGSGDLSVKAPIGRYLVTANITSKWRRILHVRPTAA